MSESTFSVHFPTELPVKHTADVIVIGGGPGGIGAAVSAARGGADVLLVEHYGFLGGMATAGEVNPFMPNHHDGKSLDTGIFTEWLDRMGTYGGRLGDSRVFDPGAARLAAEDLCVEAGVRLLYHHRVAHVETADKKITGIVLHSKSGLTAAKAKQYIDSTGDGDLAALAGCEFKFGSEDTGFAQPMTMCFKLKLSESARPADVTNGDLFQNMMKDQYDLIQEVYKKAQADGRIECPRENVLMFRGVDRDVVHFNTTRVIKHDATNGDSLSEAEVLARKQIRQIVKVLSEEVPAFKGCQLYSIAPQIGIRESRRIMGRDFVTVQDYMDGRTYADGIARVTYPIDIHNPNGTGTVLLHFPKEAWMEVPFGCLLPKDIDNLGIGARCISVDHAVHSAVRVMPPVVSLGQAIGTAAAMAVKAGKDICQVEGAAVKEELIKQ
ncbi:MAG: FAD-dependent oxidoreductase, partial [Phycisphaeraceae bacterium]|nr:FAD-dependent oxidoreductase [Phycisphaeraceae bacterium]